MRAQGLAGIALACSIGLSTLSTPAAAGPSIVVDAASGRVLEQEEATRPWYPASLTKLLTLYIALKAVKDGRVTMDTPFIYSARAGDMPPSNMGFPPGAQVTLENVLKMMMVHSANDLAVTVAEGLDGSVESFATEMNATAARLGLKDSHFANPNGLPDPEHFSSARDLAMVAVALFRDFPEYDGLYDIGAVKLGARLIPTHNNIMGRYPGIDGMKTGYTCAAGFNVVASSTRGGKHLIAVVLGSPNVKVRTLKAGALLDAGFGGALPEGPALADLPKSPQTTPPDEHAFVCGARRAKIIADEMPPLPGPDQAVVGGQPPAAAQMYAVPAPRFEPEPVFVGPKPGWTGPTAGPTNPPALLPMEAYASLNVTGEMPHAAAPAHAVARAAARRQGKGHRAAHGKSAAAPAAAADATAAAPAPDVSTAAPPAHKARAGRRGRGARRALAKAGAATDATKQDARETPAATRRAGKGKAGASKTGEGKAGEGKTETRKTRAAKSAAKSAAEALPKAAGKAPIETAVKTAVKTPAAKAKAGGAAAANADD